MTVVVAVVQLGPTAVELPGTRLQSFWDLQGGR
jgi:hypothetical protein